MVLDVCDHLFACVLCFYQQWLQCYDHSCLQKRKPVFQIVFLLASFKLYSNKLPIYPTKLLMNIFTILISLFFLKLL